MRSDPAPDRRAAPAAGARGFVLLEVLIALVIFATLVLAWSRATDNALESAAEANAMRTLRLLTSRKLAEVRAKPYEFREGGEGGFEEEVESGEENPFLDYIWKVEPKADEGMFIVAGHSDEDGATHLFPRDEEAEAAAAPEGGKAPDPVKMICLVLTVSHIPEGGDETTSMRVMALVPPQEEEGKKSP
jgi:prepilin-type N-terminal cleavage/methylation domain-containing protein